MGIHNGCGQLCVTKDFLDSQNVSAVGKQNAGTAMAEIVESDNFQIVLCEKKVEVLRKYIRGNQFPIFISNEIVVPVLIVRAAPNYAVCIVTFCK